MPQKRLMLLGGIRYLLPVIEAAHKLGCWVITVDYLPDNIAHKYSDEYHNVSILDKEAVLKLAQELKIDGISSFAVDPGVVTAAYVAEQMGLPFQCSYKTAFILQNKALFRQFLHEHQFNCPQAKSYKSIEKALLDIDCFKWPIIVKPVDSAGSKGVTKVVQKKDLQNAIQTALHNSPSKEFIIEEYLDVDGFQSSSDIFVQNGELVFPIFSDQIFDPASANPFTPAIEIWPSTMPQNAQKELTDELQRLISLLGIKTGIFNVECRLCSNGITYLMEVSPRGGGNRIAEIQERATGQSLIENEIKHLLGLPVADIQQPVYRGVWCNVILHSNKSGFFKSLEFNNQFQSRFVKDYNLVKEVGDPVEPFSGANASLGNVFLRTNTREEMDSLLRIINDNILLSIV